jgi:hypothetical protein
MFRISDYIDEVMLGFWKARWYFDRCILGFKLCIITLSIHFVNFVGLDQFVILSNLLCLDLSFNYEVCILFGNYVF